MPRSFPIKQRQYFSGFAELMNSINWINIDFEFSVSYPKL